MGQYLKGLRDGKLFEGTALAQRRVKEYRVCQKGKPSAWGSRQCWVQGRVRCTQPVPPHVERWFLYSNL